MTVSQVPAPLPIPSEPFNPTPGQPVMLHAGEQIELYRRHGTLRDDGVRISFVATDKFPKLVFTADPLLRPEERREAAILPGELPFELMDYELYDGRNLPLIVSLHDNGILKPLFAVVVLSETMVGLQLDRRMALNAADYTGASRA